MIKAFAKSCASVFMAVMFIGLVACDEPEVSAVKSVSITYPTVSAAAGSQFVSVKATGEWTISITNGIETVEWASLDRLSGEGNLNNIILNYQENTASEEREITITLSGGGKNVHCTMKQTGAEFKPVPPEVPQSPTSPIGKAWMELPAMSEASGLEYFFHSFDYKGQNYRNYSFGYSKEDVVSLWVAYPLSSFYINGSAGRTNAWKLDPYLNEDSPAPFGGYAGSYARGHMLMSDDRQVSEEANEQTFYGTNIAPQLNEHNEGIWVDLEKKIQNMALKSDTTYVVTGVVLDGSTKETPDSHGKMITLPVAYYKAVLRYDEDSTLGKWIAAAFYTEHRSYSDRDLKKVSMSIDELEKITGIDYFVNLPAKLGQAAADAVEAEDPKNNKAWW